ncbi:unnamed protein product [Candidula unifasciata]|uniref:Uncharacterized protein n=1 Tax=Candidula unifasciata TaxID=100452 RepID=A0A8S4A777_9EUPU|nr:unnamed protein product [Candidula unifasciata]
MMASQPPKVHDPMYNFDTHFPERLSRLHLHGDFNLSGSFRKKKNKTQRSGARYKTQPVTFDEITEVDEEPSASGGAEKETGPDQLKGQLQAFSRSMDGLLPKGVGVDHSPQFQHHISHSRSGSRKFQRHPECIPERVDLEQQQSPTPQPDTAENRLQQPKFPVIQPSTSKDATPASFLIPADGHGTEANLATTPPVPSPNIGQRRQKVTAKAKKRQKALEDSDVL